ncbi:MAG: porin family protein [Henriciella sp.]|nr:porin family protein [Henriciella sp.]
MKRTLSSLAVITAIMSSPYALAEGWYADAGYTHFSADIEGTSGDSDLDAITGRLGYDLTPNFGVEGEVGFGLDDDDSTVADVTTSIGLNYVVGLYGKAQMPLGERASLYARAGIVNAELEADVSGIGSTEESETGAGYGVGGTFDVSERLYVRGDYTRYDIEDVESDAFTLAVGMRF